MTPDAAPPPWRVLPLRVADAATLIEEGLALLEGLPADPVPTLRWYRSTATAVVLGRSQRRTLQAAGVDPDALHRGGLPLVWRASGGGAVLMDPGLLSLDVLVPADHPLAAGDPGQVFLHVGEAWRAALAELGVPDLAVHTGAATARVRGDAGERLLAAICYATPGRGEVLSGGRKLVGMAQRRRRAGVLVQCGLLRTWNPAPLLALFAPLLEDQPDAALTGRLRAAAAGLEELLGGDAPDDSAVMAAVERRLAARQRVLPSEAW